MYYVLPSGAPRADEVETLAAEAYAQDQDTHRHAIPVTWVDALCQHGFRRDQECIDCENGYATDHHTYYQARGPALIVGRSDDGESVAYIPERYRSRIVRALGQDTLDDLLGE